MYQRTLRLPSPLPRTMQAREWRIARFTAARRAGMTVWQAAMETGVTESTGRTYERIRLESAVAASEAGAATGERAA